MASWAVLGASWGHLGPSLGRLGGVLEPSWAVLGHLGGALGRLGGVLGPLGGQDPPEARGIRVLEASWGRLGLIFGTFLEGFWDEFSILFLPYP